MSDIIYERQGDVGVLTFDTKKNPLNLLKIPRIQKLTEMAQDAVSEGIRALVVRCNGAHFSAGADVSIFKGLTPEKAQVEFTNFLNAVQAFEKLQIPTIAEVNGLCVAGGLEVALMCDFIWASDSAQFAQAEAVIGIIPIGGGAQRLAERAGPAVARQIVFEGGNFSAEKFQQWNIVNRIVAADELQEKTLKYAQRLASGPTKAYAVNKRVMREYLDGGIAAADRAIPELSAELFRTEDLHQAVEDMLTKGPGKTQFKGK